jgi:hypothetical protein
MDERDAVRDVDEDDEDAEGEDLFGQALERYASFRLFATRFALIDSPAIMPPTSSSTDTPMRTLTTMKISRSCLSRRVVPPT